VKRADAIKAVSDCFRNEYIIACNGFTSRELFNLNDSPHNFYVLGSMGLPPAIGLGVALAKPDLKIIVITGDGNQLMSLGTLVTIGKVAPKNFIEIILDNECYETTGGQNTSSGATRFSELATSSSFKQTKYAKTIRELQKALKDCRESEGPILIHAKTEKGETPPPRARIDPVKTTKRFMKALRGN
jgi:sulfopyruvate decarboxylase subunit beta